MLASSVVLRSPSVGCDTPSLPSGSSEAGDHLLNFHDDRDILQAEGGPSGWRWPGQGWEDRAESWLRWARSPNFDAYWLYRDAFFDEVVPAPGAATLEVGCGEGRVARDLADRGHLVTAVDASPSLVAAAAAADPRSEYLVAPAERLPFADGVFDLVVAYNSLMDVEDMSQAVAEAGRVMSPGGRLAVCVTHPVSDAGEFTDDGEGAPFLITGSYLGARPFLYHAERDGIAMDFDGWAFDMECYSRALEAVGLAFELIREPPPAGDRSPRRRRIPNFLIQLSPARKPGPSGRVGAQPTPSRRPAGASGSSGG